MSIPLNDMKLPDGMKIAVSVDEACAIAGIGRVTLYSAINRGEIPVKKCGRRSLVPLAGLQKWLDALPVYQTKVNSLTQGGDHAE